MAELRKRGLPCALIISGPFKALGKAQAATFGVPDISLIEIAHPLGGLSLEHVEGRAEVAVARLLTLIEERAHE
jgi:hypothetical protein